MRRRASAGVDRRKPARAEARHPHPHIHVDHLYLAVTQEREPSSPAELRFAWLARHDLDTLGMFDDSRTSALLSFDRISHLARGHTPQAAPSSSASTGA
jgi:hypothetical protein